MTWNFKKINKLETIFILSKLFSNWWGKKSKLFTTHKKTKYKLKVNN